MEKAHRTNKRKDVVTRSNKGLERNRRDIKELSIQAKCRQEQISICKKREEINELDDGIVKLVVELFSQITLNKHFLHNE